MWFSSWLRKRRHPAPSSRRPASPRGRSSFRPRLEALEDRWLPSQIGLTVTSLADSGTGSLRAAIQAADAGSPSDKFTIGFAVAGKIDLQTPLPDLNNSIAIKGPGASSLTVERAAGFSFSSTIVTVDTGQSVSLSGLTIANGNVGGIFVLGTLSLAGCDITGNTRGLGGGIDNVGTLTVSGCIISGNSAYFAGGGIFNSGNMTVSDSTLSGNIDQPLYPGFRTDGGAIFSDGILTVSASTVSGNSAAFGGGIAGVGALTVANSNFTGNSADQGGGIWFANGPLTVRDSVFTANSATDGGGIWAYTVFGIDVRGSSFSGNTATDSGGGIYNRGTATLQQCTLSDNTAANDGGGIFNGGSGTLAVKDSTVLSNSAPSGADLYNLGALTLDDSTVGVIGP
jgi:predicted outer membrane repeat protein